MEGADWTHQSVQFRTRFSLPNSIGGRFGLTGTRNISHGSDSTGWDGHEMEFFYPEFDSEKWEQEEKIKFEQGNINFELKE